MGTLSDIVAEMRTRSREVKEAFGGRPDGVENMLDIWADRIEAAWMRQEKTYLDQIRDAMNMWGHEKHIAEHAQKPAVGNAAAMREALGDVYNTLEKIQSFIPHLSDVSLMRKVSSMVCHAKNVIDTAISAPPRQCDVGTAEEQERRYKATGEVYHTSTLTNFLAWAQTPYEAQEGGAK